MMRAHIFLALAHANGSVSRMQFMTQLDFGSIDPISAMWAGFLIAEDGDGWAREVNDENVAREIAGTFFDDAIGPPVTWRALEKGDPFETMDHRFGPAWRDDGKAVTVDMPTARDIHRDELRVLRKPLLAQLDVEYQRADETGDADMKREIAARKQALRDVTRDPAIDSAETPEALSAVLPTALRG